MANLYRRTPQNAVCMNSRQTVMPSSRCFITVVAVDIHACGAVIFFGGILDRQNEDLLVCDDVPPRVP